MPDALLRLRYSERDAAGATAAMHAVLGTGTVTCSDGPLRWEQESLVDDGVTVSRLMAEGTLETAIVRCPELVLVLVREGGLRLTERDRTVRLSAGDVGLIPLGATVQLDWHRMRVDLIAVPPAPLARLLGVREHEVQLRAPLLQPRSAALAAYLDRVVGTLTAEVFEDEEVYHRDLIRAHAVDLVVATAVEAFELVNRTEQTTDRDVGIVKRSVAFMRQHLREPVSVPQIAEAAGVSVRGLQLVFRRQLATTPLLHLRQLRLDAAREELARRTSPGTTVAQIANSYGYANAARFSTHYRNAFTESPAAALARDAEDEQGEARSEPSRDAEPPRGRPRAV